MLGTAVPCGGTMARLVVAHLLDQDARTRIGWRKRLEMTFEMLLDLALGLDDEAERHRVAGTAGSKTESVVRQVNVAIE